MCHVVAGPNGSGKSTFALRYLPEYAGAVEYVNPDLMAQGMLPTDIRRNRLVLLVRISCVAASVGGWCPNRPTRNRNGRRA